MTKSQIFKPAHASRSRQLDIRGVPYHLLEWGAADKPLLLMLHGWGDCAASFQFVVDELQEDWFVVAPDWRGFGKTHLRSDGYWFPDYLADLDAILDHYIADGSANVLGHSMGANIAGLYAGIFPERVRSFINIEGFGLPDSDPAKAPAHYRRWIEQSRNKPAYSTYSHFSELAERIIHRAPTMDMDKAMYVAEQWAQADADGTLTLRADPAHKLPNAVLYRRAEALACWAAVIAPVLLMSGEHSEIASKAEAQLAVELGAGAFAQAAQVKSVVIPGCGHMLHFEQPAKLAKAAERFLLAANGTVV